MVDTTKPPWYNAHTLLIPKGLGGQKIKLNFMFFDDIAADEDVNTDGGSAAPATDDGEEGGTDDQA